MSEPPEQEEEVEPDDPAAAADLEELLDQFREPEEPRRKSANPLWLISAFLLSVLACWLALRASGGSGIQDSAKSTALAGAMLPGKTSERLPRDEEPVDVVEDYLARCKKGMTTQEVRWIVEDFQRAGLGGEPGSLASAYEQMARKPPNGETLELLAMKLGKRQREWYASALQQALRLDAPQRSRLDQSLEKAQEWDRGACREMRAQYLKTREAGADPEWAGFEFNFLARPSSWLISDSYRPEKLADLSQAQTQVSWFNNWIEDPQDKDVDPFPASPEVRMVDLSAIRMMNFEVNASQESTWFVTQNDLQVTAGMASIIALTKDQDFRGGGVAEFAKVLHPAQLKILLLLDPEAAGEIASELEKVAE